MNLQTLDLKNEIMKLHNQIVFERDRFIIFWPNVHQSIAADEYTVV